jgi:hypothetical protein
MSSLKPTAAQIAQQQAQRRASQQTPQEEATFGIGSGDDWVPRPVNNIRDTGLNALYLQELVIKTLYFSGFLTGYQIAERVRLPFTGVIDQILETLKKDRAVEVKGSGGIGEGAFQYVISGIGIEKAREALERSQYAGPCPVRIQDYNASMYEQQRKTLATKEIMHHALQHLIINKKIFDKIGPAVNSGRSIFLFGPPGNGKTTISEAVGRVVLGQTIYIPFAIDIDGQVVRVFDSVNHEIVEEDTVFSGTGSTAQRPDPRWIKVKRPMVMVGGELTLETLDLVHDPINKYYEAPFQVKANGGMFLIDDFGRQQVRPRDLLNRWIVPLEKRVDFLTLANGRKIEVPFNVLIVFSTNLDPADLVDEAFLRRIRHKIEIVDPTFEEFRQIFQVVAKARGITYDDRMLAYLIQEWYIKHDRNLRAVHPRDLIDQMRDISTYLEVPFEMTKDLIDRACEAYFVEL